MIRVEVINNDEFMKPEDLAEEINNRLQTHGVNGWDLKDIKNNKASFGPNEFNISILIFEKR